MNRAMRRRHRLRIKMKRLRNQYWAGSLLSSGLQRLGIAIDTPTPCSNPWCCGNPRRLRKGMVRFTIQERKAELHYIEAHKKDKRLSFSETFS